MAVILSPRGNEASNMMKRFVRYEEAAQYFGLDETLIIVYAKAAGAVYQLSKIRLIKIELLEDYMKHLTKVGRSSKLIQRKFVRVGEGTLIYNIGRNRFIEMARAAGAVYKVGDSKGSKVLIRLDVFDEYEEGDISIDEDGKIVSNPVVPKACVGGARTVSQLIAEMRYGTCLWEKKYIRKMREFHFEQKFEGWGRHAIDMTRQSDNKILVCWTKEDETEKAVVINEHEWNCFILKDGRACWMVHCQPSIAGKDKRYCRAYDIALIYDNDHNGVIAVIEGAIDFASNQKMKLLCDKYAHVFMAAGCHPNRVGEMDDEKYQAIVELINYDKVLAIGETGLDYARDKSGEQICKQKVWFRKFIELAVEKKKPLVIHCRKAYDEAINILQEYRLAECPGVIHCFSGNLEQARKLMDIGFCLGVNGMFTKMDEDAELCVALKSISLEKIVFETDSPYLIPDGVAGKRNTSKNLNVIANKFAELRGESPEHIREVVLKNTKRLYPELFAG